MNLLQPFFHDRRPPPTGRLDRLCVTLHGLGERLRDDVAETLARAAAGLVHDTVRTALEDGVLPSSPPSST